MIVRIFVVASPPFFFDSFGVGPRNATYRVPSLDGPGPSLGARRDRRPDGPRRPNLSRLVVWAFGAAGYLGLLLASHGSRHADDLRGFAIVWLIVFGALNAFFILRAGKSDQAPLNRRSFNESSRSPRRSRP